MSGVAAFLLGSIAFSAFMTWMSVARIERLLRASTRGGYATKVRADRASGLVDPEADAASVRREVSELTAPSRTDRPEYKIYDAITTEALAEYRRITRQASAPRRAIHTAFARMKRAFRDWRARRA